RVHLPGRGGCGRHAHSRRGAAGGADGARGGRAAGRGGAAARVAREMRNERMARDPRAESPGSALRASCKDAAPAERARSGRGNRTSASVAFSVAPLLLGLAACSRGDRIVVGSKNLTETDLLGEIVAQQIERRTGLPLERRFHLGGTFVCHQAITSGRIDVYVEYTGTAYTAVLKHPPVADRDSVYRTVARDYARQLGLVWGKPFGFNNTFAITVRHRDAARYRL